jgi:hypothetical protein
MSVIYTAFALFIALQFDRAVTMGLSLWALRRMEARHKRQFQSQAEQFMLEQSMESLKSGKTVAH